MVSIEQILDPISVKDFFQNYWKKQHLIIRRNKFKNIYSFKHLNSYLNRYPYVRGLQIIDYTDKGDGRWCLDKVMTGKLKLPKLKRSDVFKLWKEEGKTFVIPFAENENKYLNDIVQELEKYFEYGQANVYASPKAMSKSFPPHADGTENFLFHTEGKTKWTMYSDKGKTILDEFTLDAGDLLYIPIGMYHKVETVGPRVLVSIHFKNKPKQTLEKFVIKSTSNREQWYDWVPQGFYDKKVIKRNHRLMQSSTWKKPYFNWNK